MEERGAQGRAIPIPMFFLFKKNIEMLGEEEEEERRRKRQSQKKEKKAGGWE